MAGLTLFWMENMGGERVFMVCVYVLICISFGNNPQLKKKESSVYNADSLGHVSRLPDFIFISLSGVLSGRDDRRI